LLVTPAIGTARLILTAVRIGAAFGGRLTGLAILDSTLTGVSIAVESEIRGAVVVSVTRGAGPPDTATLLTGVPYPRTLVDAPIAIVIVAIAGFLGAWVDIGIGLVAIDVAVRAGAFAEAVAVAIHTLAHAHAYADLVPTSAIVIDHVVANLCATGIDPRISVITVNAQAGGISPVTIPIVVLLASIGNHQIPAITILVEIVPGNVPGARVCARVAVIAVETKASVSDAVAVAVIVGAVFPALTISTIAVLIDAITTDL
jgi:hypothetical protein